jgi:uncharacterized membrane protein
MKKFTPIFLGVAMIFGALGHLAQPEIYAPLVPSFIPLLFANILATIAEAAIGIALVIPQTRKFGGIGFLALMIAFLPIHVWDFLKDQPFVGPKAIAGTRILIQFVLIYAGWWIYKKHSVREEL